MKRILLILFLISNLSLSAQSGYVPPQMDFAGLELKITDKARELIKEDLDKLLKSPTYLDKLVKRADLYMPIIERVFKENDFPEDFKYLSIQESHLTSDAVSSSNAVGYWQFKKETAIEQGISVNNEVDERMHIVYSSQAASKYLKKSYFMYKNWIYALLSYNLGVGGVKPHVEDKYINARKMIITHKMHWYVLRLLAHKLAFEDKLGQDLQPELILLEHLDTKGKTFKKLSDEVGVNVDVLEEYNKWLKARRVRTDKDYILIVPVKPSEEQLVRITKTVKTTNVEEGAIAENNSIQTNTNYPSDLPIIYTIYNKRVIQATDGDSYIKLAHKGGLKPKKFLKINEMEMFQQIVPGDTYYLEKKGSNAIVGFHQVQRGESIWSIAQKYGVTIRAIRSKNRMEMREALIPGRILWLRQTRPVDEPIKIEPLAPVSTNKKEPVKENAQPILEEKSIKNIQVGSTIIDDDNIQSNDSTTSEPTVEPSNDNMLKHVVNQGETLYSISILYGVTVDNIKKWNNKSDNSIQYKEELLIKNSTKK